jgi:hypothetical protein
VIFRYVVDDFYFLLLVVYSQFFFVLVTNCFSFVYSRVYYYIHEWLLEFYLSAFVQTVYSFGWASLTFFICNFIYVYFVLFPMLPEGNGIKLT